MAVKSPIENNTVRKVVKGYLTQLDNAGFIIGNSQLVELKLGKNAQAKSCIEDYLTKKFKSKATAKKDDFYKGCWYITISGIDTFYFCFETMDFIERQINNGDLVYATPFAS